MIISNTLCYATTKTKQKKRKNRIFCKQTNCTCHEYMSHEKNLKKLEVTNKHKFANRSTLIDTIK